MLRHGTPRHRDLYRDFLARLEGSSGDEATRAVFDDATVAALETDLARYLETLPRR
jgi:hypothetical protein